MEIYINADYGVEQMTIVWLVLSVFNVLMAIYNGNFAALGGWFSSSLALAIILIDENN